MSIGDKIRSGLYWSTALKFATEIFRFIVALGVARLVGPHDFGIAAIGYLALSYSEQLSSFGFGNILVQRESLTDKHIESVYAVETALSISLATAVWLAAPSIASFFDAPESEYPIRILIVHLILRPYYDIPKALLRRHIEFKFVSQITAIEILLSSCITLLLAYLNFGYWALVLGLLSARILVLPVIIIRAKWRPHLRYDHAAMRQMADFGLWNFLRAQLHFINTQFPNLVIGRMGGPVALGLFERALTLSRAPLMAFANPINNVMYSAFSRGQSDQGQLQEHFRKSTMAVSLIMFPLLLGLAAVGEHFVSILLGDDWAPMSRSLEILCFAAAFLSFSGLVASLNVGTGNFRAHTQRLSIASAVLVTLTLILAPKGLHWLAAGMLLYGIFVAVLTLHLALRTINMSVRQFATALNPALPASLLMYAVTRTASLSFLADRTILNLSAMIMLGAVCYCFVVLIRPNEVTTAFLSQITRRAL